MASLAGFLAFANNSSTVNFLVMYFGAWYVRFKDCVCP